MEVCVFDQIGFVCRCNESEMRICLLLLSSALFSECFSRLGEGETDGDAGRWRARDFFSGDLERER